MDIRQKETVHAKSAYQQKWDMISIGASLACMVHCVLLPVLFTTLPLFGIEILENIWLELLTIAVSMAVGGWALWKGYRHTHGRAVVLAWFAAGMLLMIAGNFTGGGPWEMAAKLAGAVLIITAHIRNWKWSRNCNVCKTA